MYHVSKRINSLSLKQYIKENTNFNHLLDCTQSALYIYLHTIVFYVPINFSIIDSEDQSPLKRYLQQSDYIL